MKQQVDNKTVTAASRTYCDTRVRSSTLGNRCRRFSVSPPSTGLVVSLKTIPGGPTSGMYRWAMSSLLVETYLRENSRPQNVHGKGFSPVSFCQSSKAVSAGRERKTTIRSRSKRQTHVEFGGVGDVRPDGSCGRKSSNDVVSRRMLDWGWLRRPIWKKRCYPYGQQHCR